MTLHNTVPGNPLSDVAADHLYRIAQEVIAAAARRRGCARIKITLTGTPERAQAVNQKI